MVSDVASRLVAAAEHLERGAGQLDEAAQEEIPRWFAGRALERQSRTYLSGIAEARRGVAELDRIGAPVQDARAAIVRRLDWIDPAVGHMTLPDSLQMLDIRQKPIELRQDARALRLAAELERSGEEPAAIRQALRAELQELVSRPLDQLSREDTLRIASISSLPPHLRPELPPTINPHTPLARLALEEQWPPTYSAGHVRAELDNVRLHGEAAAIDADPAITRESLDAELRSIIALPDDEITAAQAERVSLMTRLGDAKRPALLDAPRPRGFISLGNMSAWNYRPSNESASRSAFDAMRRAALEEQLLADPALTRERATDELMQVVAKADHDLSEAEVVRASTLAGLPEHLRPALPEMGDAPLGRADNAVLRPTGDKAIRTFAAVRAHFAEQQPERMAQLLAEHDRLGGKLDLELLAALGRRPGVLESVGIDSEVLHRQTIANLASIGGWNDDLPTSLRIAREVVERHPRGDAAINALRQEALDLADRNLDRMAGVRTDTYGRHPDYAEIGRFTSIASLLHELRQARPDASAGGATEVLAW